MGSGAMISAIRVAHGTLLSAESPSNQPPELLQLASGSQLKYPSRWDRALRVSDVEARTKKIKYLIIIIRFYRFMESHHIWFQVINSFRSAPCAGYPNFQISATG